MEVLGAEAWFLVPAVCRHSCPPRCIPAHLRPVRLSASPRLHFIRPEADEEPNEEEQQQAGEPQLVQVEDFKSAFFYFSVGLQVKQPSGDFLSSI